MLCACFKMEVKVKMEMNCGLRKSQLFRLAYIRQPIVSGILNMETCDPYDLSTKISSIVGSLGITGYVVRKVVERILHQSMAS